jgi:hypothetical protein
MPIRNVTLMVAGAVGAIILGFVYIFRAFGPTEAEVTLWGRTTAVLGVILAISALVAASRRSKALRVPLGLGYSALVLLQIPPIVLWFAAHGSDITDGTPPSPFRAHWGYAIPHIILLATSALTVFRVFRNGPLRSQNTQ